MCLFREIGQVYREDYVAVSLLDKAPTVLGEAGITTAERLDGIPLTDSLSAAQRPAQKPIMCDIWNHVMPNPAVGTVFTTAAGEQRFYTYNMTDPLDELYDLESGSELHNLLADGSEEAAEAVGVMAGRLSQDPGGRPTPAISSSSMTISWELVVTIRSSSARRGVPPHGSDRSIVPSGIMRSGWKICCSSIW